MTENKSTSSPLLIAAAWVIVLIPTGWGVYNTALNAMKLFKAPPPAAAPVTPVPATK